MANKKGTTWVSYFEQSFHKKIDSGKMPLEGIDKLINVPQYNFNILNYSVPMIYLLDYTTGKYVYISDQCYAHLHYSVEKMTDGGIDLIIESYHPEDFCLFNEQIFNDRLNILKEIPVEQHKEHIFTFNYRIKNGKGEYVNLLQRNSFIQSDENGNPLLSMGVITNINHFKTQNPVIQFVEKVDPINGNAELILKHAYYLREEDKIFSKREREILLEIADGLTSKQIADKLFISEHTINNHKRNMYLKSNTKNSVGLISFGYRQNLL